MEFSPRPKPAHPLCPELVGGLALSHTWLRERQEDTLTELIELLENAEYWLSFELATFESFIEHSPSPLRELGVGIALRYGDSMDGGLTKPDLERFEAHVLPRLPGDIQPGIAAAVTTLARMVAARDALAGRQAEGFAPFEPSGPRNVHELRTSSGRATITINAERPVALAFVEVGLPVRLMAVDERSRPLEPPVIDSFLGATVWTRDDGKHGREALFVIPGLYRLRVPGRAEGERRLVAR